MLENLITSKTRLRLLVKFFINVANEGYLRGLATEMQESTNAIRKELNNLSEAGYLIRQDSENKITYKANQKHPFFNLLQQVVHKYIGLDTLVELVLDRMGDVRRVYIIGDYAQGIDSGVIEVVLEGDHLNETYIANLSEKIELEIKKKVLFFVVAQNEKGGLLIYERDKD
ncbi:ArsR family transcriptional regulator [Flavobacterium sedimenticola]|uniref:ArsR family transcriptional regulator n=1 Tax=Flavobacterium sedimenticola TaxID=3043286 RepID=A0ABT6XS99_9FLAO|nr:ArsR family transcriptional regulator [Flavobacterium sedimenticola]MDI9257717.1 ArsR family transcriptional regulator [Flavobacterium sedimenticola]